MGITQVLNRPHHRLKTRRDASLERIYTGPAQRLKDTKKELTAEEQRDPTLFKEGLSSIYSANIRREGMVIIVSLKHPPPGELSNFEFPIEDSGTIARYGKLLSSAFQFTRERYKETHMAVARIRALQWLYWQAQICAIPGRQTFGRPEPTSAVQVSPSKPKVEGAPQKLIPGVQPSIHPQQAKRKEDDTGTGKPISKREIEIGSTVQRYIQAFKDGRKALKRAKKKYPANQAAWIQAISEVGLEGVRDLEFLLATKTARPAASKLVAHLAFIDRRPIKERHAANCHKKYLKHLKELEP